MTNIHVSSLHSTTSQGQDLHELKVRLMEVDRSTTNECDAAVLVFITHFMDSSKGVTGSPMVAQLANKLKVHAIVLLGFLLG